MFLFDDNLDNGFIWQQLRQRSAAINFLPRQVNNNRKEFSLLVAVFVVYTDEGTAEGEYFAEGDEDGVMDLSQWRAKEARH